jgi:transposase-like protein
MEGSSDAEGPNCPRCGSNETEEQPEYFDQGGHGLYNCRDCGYSFPYSEGGRE